MAAFEGDDPAVCERQCQMMFDLSGKEGIAAGLCGGGPLVATAAAAQADPADHSILRTHEANRRPEPAAEFLRAGGSRHSFRQQAAAEETFTCDLREAAELCQGIVDAAGSLVQIGMGSNQADILPDQAADEAAFVILVSQLPAGGEHQRMMGDDQLRAKGDSLIDHP